MWPVVQRQYVYVSDVTHSLEILPHHPQPEKAQVVRDMLFLFMNSGLYNRPGVTGGYLCVCEKLY